MGHSHLRGDISNFSHSHVEDTGWIDMTLLNGWVNYDSGLATGGSGRPCQVRKLNGMVNFRGYMRSGANGTVFWNILEGFRPGSQTTNELDLPVVAASAFGDVIVNVSGGVYTLTFNAGSTVWVNLAALHWIAEQ